MEFITSVLLDQRIAACRREEIRLLGEGCNDEANFEKIKANIYDIFKTVQSAALKKYGDDQAKAQEFFRDRLEEISARWLAAYEKAREHEDIKTMHIEQVKLAAAQDIRDNIFCTGGVEQ